jgi:hypothetical protein
MGKAIFDNLLLLKDAGAIVASGAATVAGQARVLDLGTGMIEGKMVIDSSAVDVADANETYRVALQGCNAIGFGSNVVELASADMKATGRREVPYTNEQGATRYRYMRLFTTVSGTTPSINSTAFLTKR